MITKLIEADEESKHIEAEGAVPTMLGLHHIQYAYDF
jgi:hypothetical protein